MLADASPLQNLFARSVVGFWCNVSGLMPLQLANSEYSGDYCFTVIRTCITQINLFSFHPALGRSGYLPGVPDALMLL